MNNYKINGTKNDFDILTLCEQLYGDGAKIDRFCVLVYFTKFYKSEQLAVNFTQIYSIKADVSRGFLVDVEDFYPEMRENGTAYAVYYEPAFYTVRFFNTTVLQPDT